MSPRLWFFIAWVTYRSVERLAISTRLLHHMMQFHQSHCTKGFWQTESKVMLSTTDAIASKYKHNFCFNILMSIFTLIGKLFVIFIVQTSILMKKTLNFRLQVLSTVCPSQSINNWKRWWYLERERDKISPALIMIYGKLSLKMIWHLIFSWSYFKPFT